MRFWGLSQVVGKAKEVGRLDKGWRRRMIVYCVYSSLRMKTVCNITMEESTAIGGCYFVFGQNGLDLVIPAHDTPSKVSVPCSPKLPSSPITLLNSDHIISRFLKWPRVPRKFKPVSNRTPNSSPSSNSRKFSNGLKILLH